MMDRVAQAGGIFDAISIVTLNEPGHEGGVVIQEFLLGKGITRVQ